MNESSKQRPGASQLRSESAFELRQRAEEMLASRLRNRLEKIETADVDWLVHELGVYQVEVEAQNEELLSVQEALETSRNRYRSLYEEAPVGYVTTGLNGNIVEVNQLAADIIGVRREQLIGRRMLERFLGSDRLRLQKALQQLLLNGEPVTLDLRLVAAHGKPIWVAVRVVLSRDDPHGGRHYHVALIDITQRVLLQEERAALIAIVESSDDAIIGRDLDGRVLAWNSGAERLLGFSAEQMIREPMDRVLTPERRAEDAERRQRMINKEKFGPFEFELRNVTGLQVPVLASLSSIQDESGRVVGSSLIGRDISELKRVERALHRRLRQLDLLAQASQALIMAEPGATPMQHELFDRVRLAVGGEIYMSFTLDGTTDTLRLVSAHGLSARAADALGATSPETSLCGLAATRRSALILENMQASEFPQAALLKSEGVRAYAAFPLLAGGQVHGVAAFASTTRENFLDGDLKVMQTVCDQVSAMLDRARLLEELHERERSLKLADRRKDDFIATLAHELRNPLAPIRNAIGILRRSSLPDPQLAWCRDVIERQVMQMSRLLEDLLDVSRVTRNKIELRRERTQLQRVVDEAVETTRPLIDAQRHRLAVDLPAEPILIYGDPTRLTQVIGNLLNNAAKYTDPGGQIDVVARREGNEVAISVRDSGIGIESEQAPQVFDMFAQLTPALERSRGGLGIGLSLSRGLVEMHGGRIDARSEGTGRGSEFIVHLPIVLFTGDAAPVTGPNARPEAPLQIGRRVLVVDDNADAAQTLATMLILNGMDVRVAFGGKEGLRIAEEWHPEVAVIDIGMPQFNGYELCRRIRDQAWGEHVVLIACTGWGQTEDRRRARAAGFDVHLVKPIQPDALLAVISGRDSNRH